MESFATEHISAMLYSESPFVKRLFVNFSSSCNSECNICLPEKCLDIEKFSTDVSSASDKL